VDTADHADTNALWRHGSTTTSTQEIVALSPSGDLMVAADSQADGSTTLRVLHGSLVQATMADDLRPSWVLLPSETRMVVVDGSGPLRSYELPSGRQIVDGMATHGVNPYTSSVDPTGTYVTVATGAKNIEVDAVRSVPQLNQPVPAGFGRTDTPSPSATALSPRAKRLATAVDGRIWVGDVAFGARATPPVPTVLPGSGTTHPGTLTFLTDNLLLSGSGTAVGIWDLEQYSRLGVRIPIQYSVGCHACDPGTVQLNPSGTRAPMVSSLFAITASADLRTGETQTTLDGSLRQLGGQALIWLDDDRVLAWNDETGTVSIWSGLRLNNQVARWTVPGQQRSISEDKPEQLVLTRDEARVWLADSDGRLLRFDLQDRTAAVVARLPLDRPAQVGFDPGATRVWAITADSKGTARTRVQVFDTASGATVEDRTVDGNFAYGSLQSAQLRLWSHRGTLNLLDLPSGAMVTLPVKMSGGGAVAPSQPFAVTEDAGTAEVFDTTLQAVVASFPVPTEAYAWTEVGFSHDQHLIALATEATDDEGKASIRTVRLGYDEWQRANCLAADRNLTIDEWHELTDLAPQKSLTC
jgi:hypothetical protein